MVRVQVSSLGQHLNVLAEINLRHNQVTRATDCVPSLQRLYLSNNSITSMNEVVIHILAEAELHTPVDRDAFEWRQLGGALP